MCCYQSLHSFTKQTQCFAFIDPIINIKKGRFSFQDINWQFLPLSFLSDQTLWLCSHLKPWLIDCKIYRELMINCIWWIDFKVLTQVLLRLLLSRALWRHVCTFCAETQEFAALQTKLTLTLNTTLTVSIYCWIIDNYLFQSSLFCS